MSKLDYNAVSSKTVIKGILKSVKKMRGLILLAILLNATYSILNVAIIGLMKIVMSVLFSEEAQPEQGTEQIQEYLQAYYDYIWSLIVSPDDQVQTIINLSIVLISFFAVKNVFKFFGTMVQARVNLMLVKNIRDKLMEKLTFMSIDFFTSSRQGELISITTNDVGVMNRTLINSSTSLLRDVIEVSVILILLLGISPYLTMIAFSTAILSVFFINLSRKYLKRYSDKMQRAIAEYTSTLQESLGGMRVISAYMSQKKTNDKFSSDTQEFIDFSLKHRKVQTLVPMFTEFFGISALCIVLIIGGMEVYSGQMQGSTLMGFVVALYSIMLPIRYITVAISSYPRGIVAGKRVYSLLEAKSNIESGKVKFNGFKDSIELKNMTFAYAKQDVLKDMSLTITKGQKVAFVGESGSGKSTLLDLVIRFYDPQSGEISIDGQNIKEFELESYRNHFGIVSQETILFNDTVANNMRYSKPDASDEEIIEALKTANAYDFVNKLPKKLETLIGERGLMLSGGERQRLSIARAMLRNPEILIFDEATSALDTESEKIVQSAINESLKNRTALIVAHRLATILECDVIFVFDKGKIIESGNFKELMAKDGHFKKLYDIQFA